MTRLLILMTAVAAQAAAYKAPRGARSAEREAAAQKP